MTRPTPTEADAMTSNTTPTEMALRVLKDWRLATLQDEDGEGFPLLDAVSTPGTTVATGEEELGEIAYAVAAAICKEAASLTPATDERLAELLGEIRTDLEMAAKVSLADPDILIELRALCERAGYGNVMSSASALWRERLGDLAGGEFISGPCRTTVENTIARIDTALANREQSK